MGVPGRVRQREHRARKRDGLFSQAEVDEIVSEQLQIVEARHRERIEALRASRTLLLMQLVDFGLRLQRVERAAGLPVGENVYLESADAAYIRECLRGGDPVPPNSPSAPGPYCAWCGDNLARPASDFCSDTCARRNRHHRQALGRGGPG